MLLVNTLKSCSFDGGFQSRENCGIYQKDEFTSMTVSKENVQVPEISHMEFVLPVSLDSGYQYFSVVVNHTSHSFIIAMVMGTPNGLLT